MGELLPGHELDCGKMPLPREEGRITSTCIERLCRFKKIAARGGKGMLVKKSVNIRGRYKFPNPGRCLLLLFTAAALLLTPSQGAWGDSRPKKRVLTLFPSQSDNPAQFYVVEGIKSAIGASSEFRTEHFIEYMDLPRNTGEAYQRTLVELYRRKYRDSRIDLIIPFSGPALNFAIRNRSEIFPSVPIVFSGVLEEELKLMTLPADCTGILGVIDYAGQLDLILSLHPRTRRVAVINGASSIELTIEEEFRRAFEPYRDRLDFIYLTRMPLTDILERVRDLPPDTIVLVYIVLVDGAGKGYLPVEVAAEAAAAANVPVYGAFDSYLGRGIVGGRLLSFEMLGVKAGEIGRRVLEGANPEDFPVSGHGTHLDMFDWRELKRWNIDEDRLPAGSIVQFKTPSFWDLYRWHAAGALILFVAQTALVSHLLIQRARRRRAEKALSERLAFEEVLSALSSRFVTTSPDRVDAQIARELEMLGETLDVDRVRVFELSQDGRRMTATHSFSGEKAPPSSEIELVNMPWARERIIASETIHFADPHDLPAAEKAYVTSQGIRSGLVIPFTASGAVHGVLTLATVNRPRQWSQELIRRCGMLSAIIANAMARKRSENALEQSRRFNRLILDSLSHHIAVLDRNGSVIDVNASWKRYAVECSAGSPEQVDCGTDYLDICRRAAGGGDPIAGSVVEGLSAVLEGTSKEFTLEVPFQESGKKRWFILRVVPFSGRSGGAIISRIENTERKLAETDLRNAFTEIDRLKTRLEAETAYLQDEIRLEHNFEGIIGRSPAIQYVLYKVEQVAATDTSVLVLGETGTGKELVCRAIHNNSLRKARPLVKVNCAALPANLIESELFGHERGAFTGAQARRKGRFELADGGCIFLDEIGELPLDLQGKLLRVLQDGEFERLGSSVTIKVDVRVIAATNRDLESLVQAGRFREDLFYRLNVFPITAPPLRERAEDIPLLAHFFMEKNTKQMGKRIEFIPENVNARLLEYPWPGNVRELMNVIERAVISSSGPKLRLADELLCRPTATTTGNGALKSLQEIETEYILRVLERTNQRIDGPKGAAAILKINPSTLHSRMRKLGIKKNVSRP
jgi:formate hydrogenlyase transcriptional activator